MAGLFTYGLVLVINTIIGLIFTVIGLLLGHITLSDDILLAAISGITYNQIWYVHPVLCAAIATVLFAIPF